MAWDADSGTTITLSKGENYCWKPSILKVDALQNRWKRFSKSNSSSGEVSLVVPRMTCCEVQVVRRQFWASGRPDDHLTCTLVWGALQLMQNHVKGELHPKPKLSRFYVLSWKIVNTVLKNNNTNNYFRISHLLSPLILPLHRITYQFKTWIKPFGSLAKTLFEQILFMNKPIFQFARFTKRAPPCGCACQLHRSRQNH